MWTEERTQGSASNPDFGMCCNHGRVDLPPLPDPPDEIRDLYTGTNEMARDFRQFIRQYNCALAFTSLGVEIDHSVNNGRGPYVFKIRGGLRHLSGPLSPPEGMPPSFSQLYVYDPEAALNQRMHHNRNLHQATMEVLQTTLTRDHQTLDPSLKGLGVLAKPPNAQFLKTLSSLPMPLTDGRSHSEPGVHEKQKNMGSNGLHHRRAAFCARRVLHPGTIPQSLKSTHHCLPYPLLPALKPTSPALGPLLNAHTGNVNVMHARIPSKPVVAKLNKLNAISRLLYHAHGLSHDVPMPILQTATTSVE
ncbi:hypothetical protein OF83DRAFT_1177624 [Amylostereum chailletii]|nr:hypothetical protein OF83DRAFT_1177624 [Amylostereum chailletii]